MRTRTLVILLASIGAVGSSACDKKEEVPGPKQADAKQADAKQAGAKQADAKQADAKQADAKQADVEPEMKAEPSDDFSDSTPVAGGPIALAKLGLRAQGAADAKVSDAFVGDGVTVLGTTLMATVEPAADDRPKVEADAKKQAERTYTGVRAWKAEVLPDGFAVTFENEGDLGTNYFVSARRELGGKAYWCSTTVASPDEQAAALAFCKSLATQ